MRQWFKICGPIRLASFEWAGELVMLLAEEIEKLLRDSDADGNGLSKEELVRMVGSRTAAE